MNTAKSYHCRMLFSESWAGRDGILRFAKLNFSHTPTVILILILKVQNFSFLGFGNFFFTSWVTAIVLCVFIKWKFPDCGNKLNSHCIATRRLVIRFLITKTVSSRPKPPLPRYPRDPNRRPVPLQVGLLEFLCIAGDSLRLHLFV